jgi:hypothetical protein
MMQLPEEFHIICNIIGDPLKNILVLLTHPLDFIPGLWYMQEWHNKHSLTPMDFVARRGEAGISFGKRTERLPIEEEKGEFLPSSPHPKHSMYAIGLQEYPHLARSPQ